MAKPDSDFAVDKLSRKQTQMAMYQMRVNGNSVLTIARHFGVSDRFVRYELRDAVKLVDATAWLEVETATDLARLENLLEVYWPEALGFNGQEKNPDAAHLVLKILDQKAKLLGLNAPKRVDISVLIAEWAQRRGFDVKDVTDSVRDMLPIPKVQA